MAEIWNSLYIAMTLAVFCLVMLFASFTLYVYYVHWKLRSISGPPRSNFFLGNLPEIRKRRIAGGKNIHQSLSEWSHCYRPIFVIWFFHIPLAVVSDADLVREILVVKNLPKDPFGYKRFQFVYGQRFLGCGLFSDLNVLTWEVKRRTLAPFFYRAKLISGFVDMNACCDKLLVRLLDSADRQSVVSLADEFLLVTLETIFKLGWNTEISAENYSSFQADFRNGLNGIIQSFQSPATKYMPWSNSKKRYKNGALNARIFAQSIVERRQKDIEDGKNVPDDALSRILQLKESLPDCSIEDLVDNVMTFIFAAMDTTANNLAFTMLSICLHPDVESRLRKEIDSVIGRDGEVTAKNVLSLSYLDLVIKESLRLHPPTLGVTRITSKDTAFGDLTIPADVPVMVNPYVLQTHPDYWDDPLEFKPERFDSKTLHPYAYFPFSLGPRRCIGLQLAEIEVKLVITRLLQKFTINVLPGQSLELASSITFCPDGGVRCTLQTIES